MKTRAMKETICVFLFFCVSTICNANDLSAIKKTHKGPVKEKIEAEKKKIFNSTDPKIIEKHLSEIEVYSKNDAYLYVKTLSDIIEEFENNHRNDAGTLSILIDSVRKKAALHEIPENFDKMLSSDIRAMQLPLLLKIKLASANTDKIETCDPRFRKNVVTRILTIYHDGLEAIKSNRDDNDETRGFIPPDSYTKPYDSGEDLSNCDHEETRIAYGQYKKRKEEQLLQHYSYNNAMRVRFQEGNIFGYIMQVYSTEPRNDRELKELLDKFGIDEIIQSKVLGRKRGQ